MGVTAAIRRRPRYRRVPDRPRRQPPLRNKERAALEDVTPRPRWRGRFGTSAVFFDYDKDGSPTFRGHYVEWSLDKDLFCNLDGTRKSYCTPESYKDRAPPSTATGARHLEETTDKAGLRDPSSKALGVAVLDHDDDGWPDLFGPTTPSQTSCTATTQRPFKDVGMAAGVAYSESGVARAGMGVDSGLRRLRRPTSSSQLLERDYGPVPQRGPRPTSTKRRQTPSGRPRCSASPSPASSRDDLDGRHGHLRGQRPRGRRHPAVQTRVPSRSRRTCSRTSAAALRGGGQADGCRFLRPWWRVGRLTATTTATATSTWWSARTTGPLACCATTAATPPRPARTAGGTGSGPDGLGRR